MILRLARFFGIPLVNAELHRQARRGRIHFFRWTYLLLICVVFGSFWCIIDHQRQAGFGIGIRQAVTGLFATITWMQFLLLSLAGAQCASNMIAEERSRDTLTVMLSTPLSSTGILLGKLLSILIRTLLYILALLPMFGLLMMEGGLSPTQIIATAVLTLFQVAICSSLAMFGAVVNKKANAGVGLALLYLIFGQLFFFAIRNLFLFLSNYPQVGSLLSFSEETWLKLNIFRAFNEVATGSGVMFTGSSSGTQVAVMLLGQTLTTLLFAGFFFVLAAAFLRPVSQLGKLTIWQATWRNIFGTRKGTSYTERHSWEVGTVTPWPKQVYAWRGLGFAASPSRRRLQLVATFFLTIAFVIAPLLFYCGEFAVRYTCYAVEEVIDGKGLPPMPEHPVFEGGSYTRKGSRTVFLDKKRTRQQGRVVTTSPWRNPRESREFVRIWFVLWICVLAGIVFLTFAFGLASSAAKERERKRFSLLLTTPLTSSQIAFGLVAQGFGGRLGMFVALPLLAAGGLLAEQLVIAPTIAIAVLLALYFLLYGSLALRFGLLSRSVRVAQSKLGGVLFGFGLGWLIVMWFFAAVAMFTGAGGRGAGLLAFLFGFSPLALPFITGVSAYEVFQSHGGGSQITSALIASISHMVILLIVGLVLFEKTIRSIRQYAQRADAKKR